MHDALFGQLNFLIDRLCTPGGFEGKRAGEEDRAGVRKLARGKR